MRKLLPLLISVIFISCQTSNSEIDTKVKNLLSQMTLEEKIGQMNQYNGFYNATGPAPEVGDQKVKYENVKNGLVGSMLNVRGVDEVRAFQKSQISSKTTDFQSVELWTA